MSTFTTLRDKLEHLFATLFGIVEPLGEQVVKQTSQDVVAAALAGSVHGSDDMIAVAKASLKAQAPALTNAALTAAAAVVAHHEAEAASNAALVVKEGE